MSKVDFRTGSLSRAYAGVVGVNRSGVNFVRKRVTPRDPQTANQLNYRQAIKELTYWGRRMYAKSLEVHSLGTPPRMTKFNRFVQVNTVIRDNKAFLFADMVIYDGNLFNPGLSFLEALASPSEVNYEWSTVLEGEAKNNDSLNHIIINERTKILIRTGANRRDSGNAGVNMSIQVGDIIHVYQYIRSKNRDKWAKSSYAMTIAVS